MAHGQQTLRIELCIVAFEMSRRRCGEIQHLPHADGCLFMTHPIGDHRMLDDQGCRQEGDRRRGYRGLFQRLLNQRR